MGVSNWTFQNPHFELGAAKWAPQSARFKSRHLKEDQFFKVGVSKRIRVSKWAFQSGRGRFKVGLWKWALQASVSTEAFQSERFNVGASTWTFQNMHFKLGFSKCAKNTYFESGSFKIRVLNWAFQSGRFKVCVSKYAFQTRGRFKNVGVSKQAFQRRRLSGRFQRGASKWALQSWRFKMRVQHGRFKKGVCSGHSHGLLQNARFKIGVFRWAF